MRSKVIAGNWKMNNGPRETHEFVRFIEEWLANNEIVCAKVAEEKIQLLLFPPFVSLDAASHLAHVCCVSIGGQNVHWESQGAFTGEISVSMLREQACTHCLVGHSERRHLFCETNEQIAKKLNALIESNMTPILCVGETLSERETGQAFNIVQKQLIESWERIYDVSHIAQKLMIAYEPVWAIGTGKTARPEDAQEFCAFIRKLVKEKFGEEAASKIRILYGGSVTSKNTIELLEQPDVDGLLIGGASVKAPSYIEIILEAMHVIR